MSPYAEGTSVTPERSQAEIATILRRYGADGFAYGWEGSQAAVTFAAQGRRVRFVVPLPHRDDHAYSDGGRARKPAQIDAAVEAEVRRRWRALTLAIKAKLEVVETGISTFEEEFLAHIVLPSGRTVAEETLPAIQQAYDTGRMPTSFLAIEGPK